jgi:hypothetical protein
LRSIAAHRLRIQRLIPLAIEAHLRAIHAAARMPAPPEAAFSAIREAFADGSAPPYSDDAVRGILAAGVPLDTMSDDELFLWLVDDLNDAESQAILAQVKPS